jgi:hypothetical protein
VSMGGRAEGLACADQGARTPIGAIRNILFGFPISVVFHQLNRQSFNLTNLICDVLDFVNYKLIIYAIDHLAIRYISPSCLPLCEPFKLQNTKGPTEWEIGW